MKNWNLEKIYANDDLWLKDFATLKEEADKVSSFKGKLTTKEGLEAYYIYSENFEKQLGKMYGYAHMKGDQNQKITIYQDFQNKMRALIQTYVANASYVENEILSKPYETYVEFAKNSTKINEYLFNIKRIFDARKHILSPNEEKILANYQLVSSAFGSLYAALQNGDASTFKVKLTSGEEIEVSTNTYTSVLQKLEKQEDRRLVFEAQFAYYEKHKYTLASIYKGVVDSNIAKMKSRGYNSVLELYLDSNKIPTDVFMSLINTVRKNTAPLKRYINLRKKLFGLDEYHTYDRFLAYSKADVKYPYEKAVEDVFAAVKPMGEDFLEHAKRALAEGHVDVYPAEGKRSGAYSTHAEGYGPYILLNHADTLDSAFTVAHECGHSIHTLYSTESQPYATKDYVIFVAEIPSTFNEQLFLDYLLKNSNNRELKIQALEQQMDGIVQTFYRQTLFANFEYEAHRLSLEGESLNYEVLSKIMKDLYFDYYGIDLDTEPLKKFVWAYIPHMFYTPFYVYQYATCFSASMKMYENVKNNVEGSKENYIKMLKAGASNYPVEIVKIGGVDLTSSEPFAAVCDKLDTLLDEYEKLINEA